MEEPCYTTSENIGQPDVRDLVSISDALGVRVGCWLVALFGVCVCVCLCLFGLFVFVCVV